MIKTVMPRVLANDGTKLARALANLATDPGALAMSSR